MRNSPISLSRRLNHLSPSATVGLGAKIAQLRAQGIDVISFGQGEPDFPTPAAIKAAGIQAIERNQTRYSAVGGPQELRAALAQRVTNDTGIAYTATQVSATTGAKEALLLAFLALCDPGDEVVIPAPYWVSYVDQARIAGATPVTVLAGPETGFKITPAQLHAAMTPRTKVVLLNSPSNPTGAVYTSAELAALAEVLRTSAAVVISDEIYDAIVYTPYARWLRVAPDFADRTLVVNGASKSFAMTGWRFGYVAGPIAIMEGIKAIQGHASTHTSSITQAAALAAYDGSIPALEDEIATMVAAFHERRNTIVAMLNAIPGVHTTTPDGAFYVFPDVRGLFGRLLVGGKRCANDDELAAFLLEQAHIGVVPGSAFGLPGFLRLSYATGMAQIEEGMRRFQAAIE